MRICDRCGADSKIERVKLTCGRYDTILREYDLCEKCRGELVNQIQDFIEKKEPN